MPTNAFNTKPEWKHKYVSICRSGLVWYGLSFAVIPIGFSKPFLPQHLSVWTRHSCSFSPNKGHWHFYLHKYWHAGNRHGKNVVTPVLKCQRTNNMENNHGRGGNRYVIAVSELLLPKKEQTIIRDYINQYKLKSISQFNILFPFTFYNAFNINTFKPGLHIQLLLFSYPLFARLGSCQC